MTDATNVRTYLQIVFAALAFGTVLSADARGKVAVTWDFTKGVQGWRANKYVEETVISSEGLAFRSTGNDPWIEGPAVDLPGEGMTRVRVSMKSNADAHAELFYSKTFQAGRSVRFTVLSDGQWHDYSVLIHEPLGPGTRFRLDPAASEGAVVVRSIQIEILAPIREQLIGIGEKNKVLSMIFDNPEIGAFIKNGRINEAKKKAREVFDVYRQSSRDI